ncbi:endoplasmic reticulum membrane sensor NFE2L1-like isoform X1 [Ruditapes philippinarum]|uniref:endoplasmic reticulum membrane sensor NFE2L1-like isoform X1 n=1 Tax=Ruditapes philippinarum TaxID=129788 RepID=UPI00295BB383|nr:endoplasmic reticulum membrane sensor NFE2L1-like isoform X1 [Ruditapes philippinarum]
MLKQYFTDGLVQIAILLSILRTDLNSLNREYVNYPEVQEIILGQTAAYTHTNFHIDTINNRLGSPEIYRKNIDTEHLFSSSIYREIRSFRPRRNEDLNVPTFLLVSGTPGPVIHSQDTSDQNENEDENNNNIQSELTLSSEDLELEAENLLNTLEETIGAISPNFNLQNIQGTDPTSEDLDLIEVLWRQDIDLGVGKEVFDPNLRRELEREREIELQKERQKQKEQELIQKKLDEQRNIAQQRWLADNFTQDGETGEWVPMGGSQVPPPAPEISNVGNGPEQFMSSFDSIPMMGDGMPQENNNYSVAPPPPQYQGPQSIHQHPPQPVYNANMGQYNQQLNNSNMTYGPHPQQQQPVQCNMGQAFHQSQQQQYNNTGNFTNHQQHNYTHIQNMSQTQQQQGQNYPRQSSLEATWQDLVNILDLPPNNQSRLANANQRLMNGTVPNSGMPAMQNTSSMLIQNATMPTPAPMNGNVTFNNSGMVSQCHRSPPHSSGMMSPCGENFNSSMPSGSGMGSLDWESCGDLIFPNITSDLNEPEDPIDDVDELLPDLITEDELEDINFSEMGLTDAVTPTPTGGYGGDDASSDSAVSMGSQSDTSPDMNDFSDSALSPYDGLEGATGGHEASQFPKTSKYDPDDFKYGNSCSYSSGGESNGSNFSSSSNDTGGSGHFSQSNGGGCFSPGGQGHINHNHTYPLKPGAEPKDYSKKNGYNNNKEGRHKGPQSKDHKRIMELKVPFSVDQIVNSPVEEFNEMLTRHKFNDQQLQLIRDIRRRGKNKVAAQNCRKRKIGVIEHLEDEMTSMEKFRDKLLHERHMMDKQTREMKEKLGLLYSEIFHSLRDDHGQPYDPARFSLQQSNDGDVFLVPRNYTTEDEHSKKRKEERK